MTDRNHTDHNRSEVNWSKSCLYKFGILVIDFGSENRDVASLYEKKMNKIDARCTVINKLTP